MRRVTEHVQIYISLSVKMGIILPETDWHFAGPVAFTILKVFLKKKYEI